MTAEDSAPEPVATVTPNAVVEFNCTLDRVQLSPEAWFRLSRRLRLQRWMRDNPPPRRTFVISVGENPDVFIVEEIGKD